MLRLTLALIVMGVAMSISIEEALIVDALSAGLSRHDGRLFHHGEAFTGTVLETDDSGTVRARTPYRDGREDGIAYRWFDNGQLESERHYRSGEKVGRHRGFWRDGAPSFVESFAGGVYDGELRVWHENGRLHQLRHFERGREVGTQRSWSANGGVEANYVVEGGRRFGLLGARPCFVVKGAS